jgi:hypothetical protein
MNNIYQYEVRIHDSGGKETNARKMHRDPLNILV